MEYALSNGLRSTAQPGLKGICAHCGEPVQAKCGTKLVWHWAHLAADSCDSWHEPETPWHRAWKACFGADRSEVAFRKDGLMHIADAVNANGIIFEFQNSFIPSQEIQARERFYGEKMIWVVNGESFREQFRYYDEAFLRHWKVVILSEIDAATRYAPLRNGLLIEDWQVTFDPVKQLLEEMNFAHLREYGVYFKPLVSLNGRVSATQQVHRAIEELYARHRPVDTSHKGSFTWEHPRRSWEEARRPVFIDLGEGILYLVEEGMGKSSGRGMRLSRERFLGKYAN